MKKSFLCAFGAVVLGVAIMLFPLWTYFKSYGEEGPIAFTDSGLQIRSMTESESWDDYLRAKTEGVPLFDDLNVSSQPADASLRMLAIGFFAAMVVYFFVRKRIPRPTRQFGFPRW